MNEIYYIERNALNNTAPLGTERTAVEGIPLFFHFKYNFVNIFSSKLCFLYPCSSIEVLY